MNVNGKYIDIDFVITRYMKFLRYQYVTLFILCQSEFLSLEKCVFMILWTYECFYTCLNVVLMSSYHGMCLLFQYL